MQIDDNDNTMRIENGKLLMLNPMTGEFLPVINVEEEMRKLQAATEKTEEDIEFERLFAERRSLKLRSGSDATLPPPGGVGYGMFYKSAFQNNFTYGTSIAHDIICPATPGAGVTTTLYLTSTNRAAKGVEALIHYNGNTNPCFRIYDWALSTPAFVLKLTYSQLSKYRTTKLIHGSNRQIVAIQNRTRRVSGNTWRNVVWLVNQQTNTWEQVYSYDYTATASDQKDSHYGSWGPIVETFQSSYSGTNTLGFYATQLQGQNSSGTWSGFQFLSSSQSTIRNDNLGFSSVFLDANYTFGVHA